MHASPYLQDGVMKRYIAQQSTMKGESQWNQVLQAGLSTLETLLTNARELALILFCALEAKAGRVRRSAGPV